MKIKAEKAQFNRDDVDIIAEKSLFKGFFHYACKHFRHKLFEGGWSPLINREVLLKSEASAAVLYDPVNDLVGLIDQFRVGALESEYGPWCLEVVAGMIDPGETPESLILREIQEEAGINEVKLTKITSYYSTPGGCNEKIHIFCAFCDLSRAQGVFGLDAEGEDILLHTLPAQSVFESMLSSRMNNGATLIGLQWLQLNRDELRRSAATAATT